MSLHARARRSRALSPSRPPADVRRTCGLLAPVTPTPPAVVALLKLTGIIGPPPPRTSSFGSPPPRQGPARTGEACADLPFAAAPAPAPPAAPPRGATTFGGGRDGSRCPSQDRRRRTPRHAGRLRLGVARDASGERPCGAAEQTCLAVRMHGRLLYRLLSF